MSGAPSASRGPAVLRDLLAGASDLRDLDLPRFRRWLAARSSAWSRDPVFRLRAEIRDLRRAAPELRALEGERDRAAAADAASPGFRRLRELERRVADAGKAVAGLAAAVEAAEPEDRPRLRGKLEDFRRRRDAAEEERARLAAASAPRRDLARAEEALRRARDRTGLDAREAELRRLLAERGRRSVGRGRAFEEDALAVTRAVLLPGQGEPSDAGTAAVLRRVTLGAADLEIDLLVVRRPADAREPVEALALVEAKRSPDDLAHGFRRRQADLAWLTGEPGDAAPERPTRAFPSGRFDRDVVHREGGEAFVLGPASFRGFRRDPGTGWFLDRVHLVTRRAALRGLSSAAIARVAHRVSTDERWDPGDDRYLGHLLRWCRSLAHPLESPDLLRLYLADPRRSDRIAVVERDR